MKEGRSTSTHQIYQVQDHDLFAVIKFFFVFNYLVHSREQSLIIWSSVVW